MFLFLFHHVLFSYWMFFFSLSCSCPLLSPIESGFDCHFIFQYNQEQTCHAPLSPFGGSIAMLYRFICANRVEGSLRQCWDLELGWQNLSRLTIFHSDQQNLYFLAYYWQFSFQKLFLWSLIFVFNYQWLVKRTAQTVTLLEKSGKVWSHTGLKTFQKRKGFWKETTNMSFTTRTLTI